MALSLIIRSNLDIMISIVNTFLLQFYNTIFHKLKEPTAMDNEKLFDLMTKMYADLKAGQDDLKKGIKSNSEEISQLKKEVKSNTDEIGDLKKVVLHIEEDHGKKLDALFDGYKQNSEKLTRIEEKVSKHEEIILKRVK